MIERLAIVGAGLIGASVGLAAKGRSAVSVAAYDRDEEVLAVAAERGAVDVTAASLEEALTGAELAVAAVPVAQLGATVRAMLEASSEGCAVTDVGSTKAAVCAAASPSSRFVGGHPLTGAETSGPEHASPGLFEGASWFLTPTAETDPACYRLVHSFVAQLGATPVAIDPLAHDRLVALTSHLPHALANVLVNQAAASRIDGHDPLSVAGGSLRDMTRVAGANPRIWVDILLENSQPMSEALAEHRRRIEQLERALAAGDAGFLARWVGDAARNRRKMLEQAYPDPGSLQRIRVHVPDRPGVLAGITQALSAERINLEDFELKHLSPERGGTLTLFVAGEREARRATELLEAQGYAALVFPALDEP